MNDDELHQLLRSTPAPVRFPGSFRQEVWSRIEAEEDASLAGRWRRVSETVFGWLARPLPASATCVVMIALGAMVAMGSNDDGAQTRLAYVRSISPVAAHAHTHQRP